MQDPDIENLLRRYRPLEPNAALSDRITNSLNREITRSERSWPWAVAAAALLAVSVGLHAAVLPPPETSSLIDAARVQAIVDQLGGSPENRIMAEWIASREAMLERERLQRASGLELERQ